MNNTKKSLIKKIVLLLIVVLIASNIVTGVLRALSVSAASRRVATRVTKQAASAVAHMLDGDIIEECISNSKGEVTTELKESLIEICNDNNLLYIYIFLPDFENKAGTYVLAAATEEAKNVKVNQRDLAGKVSSVKPETLEKMKNAWDEKKGDVSIRIRNEYGDFANSFALIKDGDEKIALVGAGYDTGKIVRAGLIELAIKMLVALLVWVIVIVIIGIFLRKRIVNPILVIADKMRFFTSDMQNNQFEPLEFNTGDEIQTVADSFNVLSKELTTYIDEVKNLVARESRVATEIEVARKIQYGIVSAKTEKDISDFYHLSCRMNSARSVGGDFYDYFELKNGLYCMLIGDVSGKGIGAAMFMMLVKAILHEKLINTDNPAKAVSEANDEICANNPENMFATVFVALYDEKNKELSYVNAGHNAPIIIKNSIAEELKVSSGIALGIFDKMDFTLERISFDENDAIVMYTDGVTECINENKEFLGTDALIKTVQNSYNENSNYCDEILSEIEAFRKDAEQFDDITLVALGRIGK